MSARFAAGLIAGAVAVALATRPMGAEPERGSPAPPDRVELTPPEGVVLDGALGIESRQDGKGVLFVAASARTPKGYGAVVWTQTPKRGGGWEVQALDLGGSYPGGNGRLSVEADGQLYLTVWGKDNHAYRLRLPGWTPWGRAVPGPGKRT